MHAMDDLMVWGMVNWLKCWMNKCLDECLTHEKFMKMQAEMI